MWGQQLRIAAQRMMRILKPEDAAGSCVPPHSAATFEAVAHRYMSVKEETWGAHAGATAKSVIRKHLIGNLGRRRVDELTAEEIQAFIDGMVRNNASQSLLSKVGTHLCAILELAQELELIRHNPMRNNAVKFEHKSRKPKSERFLSLEECRALFAELYGRDHLIVRMFIQLGLLPEELFALRRDDVQDDLLRIDEVFTLGEIRETKSEGSAVNVYVPPGLHQELHAWLASTRGGDRDWLFPDGRSRGSAGPLPVGQNSFRTEVLKPAAERAGISDVDLLTLRRTWAAHFGNRASAGPSLTQMRLSNRLTPFKYYPQRLPESLKTAAVTLEAEIFADAELHHPRLMPTDLAS